MMRVFGSVVTRWRKSLASSIGLGLLVVSAHATAAPPQSVVVLMYHHVSADTPRVTSVTAEELRSHLSYLRDNGFTVVAIEEAVAALSGAADAPQLPDKAVVLTFDDGWDNNYTQAVPVLREFKVPYTIFVNPALMEKQPHLYMTWAQLREIDAEQATIANHSSWHKHMTWRTEGETENAWQQRVIEDIETAQMALEEKLQTEPPRLFAYPFGEYNNALQQILADLDYVAFGQHSGAWGEHTELTAIPRFPAAGNYANLNTLKTKLSSLALPIEAVTDGEMVRDNNDTTPTLQVSLRSTDDFYRSSMTCFIGGEAVTPEWDGNSFSVAAPSAIPIGRSRYNCTVPSISGEGRYYWYSHPWVRADTNGRWPD